MTDTELDLVSGSNAGVAAISSTLGTLGGFIPSSTTTTAASTNYLTIEAGVSAEPVQLIVNSPSNSVSGAPAINASLNVNPFGPGAQLITPRLNVSKDSNGAPMPIVWGQLSPSGSATLISSQPDPTNNPLWVNESVSGSVSSVYANNSSLNKININDNLDVGPSSGPAFGLLLQDSYGGTSFIGGRAALVVNLLGSGGALNGNVANSLFFGAAQFNATANASAGGTATTCVTCASGALNGINPEVHLQSGATNWRSLSGEEIDVEADAGSSFVGKAGLLIVQNSSNVAAGSALNDGALEIGGSTSPAFGWNFGLVFGGGNGGFPFQTNASLIYAGQPQDPTVGQSVASWGIDMTGALFGTISANASSLGSYMVGAGGGFAKSLGFAVDGQGNLTAQSATIGNFSLASGPMGLAITAPNAKVTSATITNQTAAIGWLSGDKAITSNGGVYLINTVKNVGGLVNNNGYTAPSGSTAVTITLGPYLGALCSPYPVYTTMSSGGTISNPLTISTQGTCSMVPAAALQSWVPASITPSGFSNVTVNVSVRVASIQMLVADVVAQTSIPANPITLTPSNCFGSVAMMNSGFFRANCGSGLTVNETWTTASDIVLGTSVTTTSTSGYTHPFATVPGVPAGAPANSNAACVFNTNTSSIDCYNGTAWYGTSLCLERNDGSTSVARVRVFGHRFGALWRGDALRVG